MIWGLSNRTAMVKIKRADQAGAHEGVDCRYLRVQQELPSQGQAWRKVIFLFEYEQDLYLMLRIPIAKHIQKELEGYRRSRGVPQFLIFSIKYPILIDNVRSMKRFSQVYYSTTQNRPLLLVTKIFMAMSKSSFLYSRSQIDTWRWIFHHCTLYTENVSTPLSE